MNQSVSVHSLASSRVMRTSSLHPQHDTSTLLVSTRPLAMGWVITNGAIPRNPSCCTAGGAIMVWFFISFFISLSFLSLTEDSLAQFQKKSTLKHHFFEKSFFYFFTILLDIGTIIVIFNFIIGPKCLPIKDLRAGVGPEP